ncbi:MAG: peptidoglycan-binding protein [Acidimicrobiaceae bacterium]|nr:peptidoglycan-binding protein [Acidimicrobiaceae bacterium]
MVQAFQRSRGLPITGEVDTTTWSRLVEAGWELGSRLLYLAQPLLRGDDVAELQVRLAQLGFNPGRIDGIFGPVLDEALRDFQRNCALDATGELNRSTLLELERVTATFRDRSLVTEARDAAGFNPTASGPVVVCGKSPLLQPLVSALSAMYSVDVLLDKTPEEVAAIANASDAALVLSVEQMPGVSGIHLHYWASYRSHSRQGERLASLVASAFSHQNESPRVEVTGMALPLLRETRMITLRIEHESRGDEELHSIAKVICDTILQVIHR